MKNKSKYRQKAQLGGVNVSLNLGQKVSHSIYLSSQGKTLSEHTKKRQVSPKMIIKESKSGSAPSEKNIQAILEWKQLYCLHKGTVESI